MIFWQKYEISTSKILDFAKYNTHKNSKFFQGENNSFCKFSVHCENKTKVSVFRLFNLQYGLFGFIEKKISDIAAFAFVSLEEFVLSVLVEKVDFFCFF